MVFSTTLSRAARCLAAVALAAGLTFASSPRPARAEEVPARAEEAPSPAEDAPSPAEAASTDGSLPRVEAREGAKPSERDYFAHPYGLVEFGIGVLALPDAKLCGGEAGCDKGDISLEVDAWPLFRASPNFAVGAGMTLALIPMQDVPRQDTRFPRDHSRRYFIAEGIGRYYFIHGPALELWSGISGGLIVVSDNFRTRSAESNVPLVGSDSANIATEGLSLGLGTGVTFGVNPHLQVGATLRFANWYLPPDRQVIAFGEEASLSNRVTMLNLALTVAYHSR
jgi:hypothetical protein